MGTCTNQVSKFANSLLKKTRQDSSFLPYNNATLTCLLQYFLEQQRRKWSEQTVAVDLASSVMLMNTHLSCLLWREKVEKCWVVDFPRSPSAQKFCHSVTALLRALTVVKQYCIVG